MADVPAPTEVNRGPRVETKSGGIGYFIPPELREKGRQLLNLASALDPVQGIMRGMRASGQAFDSELSVEERKRAAIEAGLETAAPLMMMGMGALAKQPIKATVLDVLTPTGAPKEVVDDIADPSRRKFIKSAVATGGIAAIAPDVITEALEKVPAAVSRVKPVPNPIDIFSQNMKILRREMEEAYDAADEMDVYAGPVSGSIRDAYDEAVEQAEKLAYDLDATTEMDLRELVSEMGSKEIAGATDESIEELSQALTDFRMVGEDEYIEQMIPLAEEIKRRGLLGVKENGITQYPYARSVVDDVDYYLRMESRNGNISTVFDGPKNLQMIEADDFVRGREQKLKQETLNNIILKGKDAGDSTDVINKKVVEAATRLKVPYPKRAFDDPKVEYVDTQTIADNVAQFNFPRYDVGKFGGDLESGDLANMPKVLEEFEASGKETLKENIFNEGIKEPIEIELEMSGGGLSISQGHHRLQAALELGIPEIPILVRTFEQPRAQGIEVMRPATLDTSGLKSGETYSFSELNLNKRLKTPKETAQEMKERGGTYFMDSDTMEVSDRKFPQYVTPMREGFFRVVDEKADGGEMRKGVGSLSETARRMNEGGEVSIDAEVNAIIPAVIMTESTNNPKAVSEDGAIGLMQVLPRTAMKPGFGVPTIFEIAREEGFYVPEETEAVARELLFMPDLNVEFGSRYLKAMRNKYDNMEDALRAYNAGPTNFNNYLTKGRDLNVLTDEAIQYPLKVAAANQGVNPNEPLEYQAFTDSPQAFPAFMEVASQERPVSYIRPRARPPVEYTGPRPKPRPKFLETQLAQKEQAPTNLRQKYSPEGIEQMLTGTIGEPLLPVPFQQGSPYSSRP